MYSFSDVQREIGAKIQWLIKNNGSVLHPQFIAHSVASDHPDVDGADADFYKCCSFAKLRDEVRQQINRMKVKTEQEDGSEQLVMPGFEHLQQRYFVDRDGENCIVKINEMSDDEIEAKAQEREAMGRACYAHADELRRYRELRKSAA